MDNSLPFTWNIAVNFNQNNNNSINIYIKINKYLPSRYRSRFFPASRGPNSNVSLLRIYFLMTISSGFRNFFRCRNTTLGSRLILGNVQTPRQKSWYFRHVPTISKFSVWSNCPSSFEVKAIFKSIDSPASITQRYL